MVTLAGVLVFLFCAIVAGRWMAPQRPLVGVLTSTAIVAVATWVITFVIWLFLLNLNIVKIDPLLRWLGLYRLEQPWQALLGLGPPTVVAVAAGLVAAMRARSRYCDHQHPRQGESRR